MSSPVTITMLAPDGSRAEVPIGGVDQARQAGAKVAVQMRAPQGDLAWVPADQVHNAAVAGAKMVPMQIPEAAKASYWDALTNPVGSGGQEQGILGGIKQIGGQAIKAAAQPFMHPLQTAGALLKTAGDYATGGPVAAAQDVVAPMVQNYMADKAQGGHALALENLAGQVGGSIEGGRVLGAAFSGVKPSPSLGRINNLIPASVQTGVAAPVVGAASNAAQNVKNYLRPPISPDVVADTEMAARKLSAAVLPATKDASNFIQAAQNEVPNILEYANKTGNPLNTQLEFAKAAQGNAQEVRNFYDKEILGPVSNKLVKTSGSGFGSQTGEGPDTYATLGEIDNRVIEINKQLDKPTLNVDDARRALASKVDLQAEAGKLRDILHQNLSQATGIDPQDIANIRQRVGQSYELANDTNAAVTSRMQAAGRTDMGPITLSTLPSRALEFTRGGPVPIADRAFQRAIRDFPGQSQGLPPVNPPPPGMTPPIRPGMAQALGGGPTQPPSNVSIVDPQAQLDAMSASLANRGAAVQSVKSADMATAAQRAARLDQLLKIARERQPKNR